MQVTFNVRNARELQSFFSQGLVDFLDFLILKHNVLIIANNVEVYSHYSLEVISREDFTENVCVRVDRNYFMSLISDGVVNLFVGENNNVELTIKPTRGGEYNMYSTYQASDISTIYSRLELMENSGNFVPINLFKVERALKVIKNLTSVINVNNGMVVVELKGMQLYYKAGCENFNLDTNVANFLLKFSDDVYGYQNFIIGRGQDTVIIAKQSRASIESDLSMVLREKYSHKLKTKLSNVCNLVKSCGFTDTIVLDFEQEVARVVEGSIRFSAKFKVDSDVESINAKRSEISGLEELTLGSAVPVELGSVHAIPTLVFPTKVLKDVVGAITNDFITIKIKRTFVQLELENGTFIVVIRRKDFAA
jgi:hypothetical protein